ncbi:MAG: DUF3303 family protein [Solirubrobacterales bacterium]
MKLLVIYRWRNSPDPEAMPMMLEGLKQWFAAYGDKFEASGIFAGGGGFGLGEFDSSEELQKMTAEHPFTAISDVEIKVVADPQTSMQNLAAALAARS